MPCNGPRASVAGVTVAIASGLSSMTLLSRPFAIDLGNQLRSDSHILRHEVWPAMTRRVVIVASVKTGYGARTR